MAILKIARMGHAVLRGVAEPVADPTAPEIAALVEDMKDTLADAGGVGLAAPQVHVAKRLVIFYVPVTWTAGANRSLGANARPEEIAVPMTVLINPVIEPLNAETADGWESCLSIPGLTGLVPRFSRIRYSGLTLSGERIVREATGFHARVVQHECDHLDGVLYPMRVGDLKNMGFVEEMRRHFSLAGGQAA